MNAVRNYGRARSRCPRRALLADGASGAAADRGYHWLTFDGPGQEAMLFEHGIPFRPDWEAVLTPVLDGVLARSDVDPDRVAVIGVGQGGYWVTRALAFEHRFAAAVVDPGSSTSRQPGPIGFPSEMRQQLDDRRQSAFDREMHLAELFAPSTTATVRFHGEPYGHNAGSTFRLFSAIAAYRLGDEVQKIDTPILLTESEGEQLWPGQSRRLYERLPGPEDDRDLHDRRAGRRSLRAARSGGARGPYLRLARGAPRRSHQREALQADAARSILRYQ